MKSFKSIAKRVLEALHLSPEYNVAQSVINKGNINSEKKTIKKKKNNFQLISIHIPKSGGTSFYDTLQGVYGKKTVVRVDYKPHLDQLLVNTRAFTEDTFPDHIKVIHGHIRHNALEKYIDLPESVKIITWLRNPVERIISDYYYVKNLMSERYSDDPYNPNILKRMTKSLIEFAAAEVEQNRMTKFLGPVSLEEFYFVGVLEYFEEDLEHLSSLLNWGSYSKAMLNKTKNKPQQIPDEVIEKIKEFNREDIDLYEKALNIRNRRIKN